MASFTLTNASLPRQPGRHTLVVEDGVIVSIEEGVRPAGPTTWDVDGRLVAPGFVDAHTHLDKALTDDRIGDVFGDAGLEAAIRAVRELKAGFDARDVAARADRALGWSVAHGVTALRTNCETDRFVGMRALDGLSGARDAWRDRIDVQLIAFPQEGWFDTPGTIESGARAEVRAAVARGGVLAGGNVNGGLWPSDPARQVDELFEIARAHDADIDMHLDNWDGPQAFTLPHVAARTIEHGWQGRVAVSHIPSLAHVSEAAAADAIDLVKRAGVHVCVLPTRMKLTRVHALMEAGVGVSCGTDNMRDPFVRYGDADILAAALLLAQILGMLSQKGVERLWDTITTAPARMLRIERYGLAVGNPADLVVLDARDVGEAILHQAARLAVFKRGRQVAGTAVPFASARGGA